MNPNLPDELAYMAARLNVRVDQLWDALREQAFIYGVCNVLFLCVFTLTSIWLAKMFAWVVKKAADPNSPNINITLSIIYGGSLLFSSLVLVAILSHAERIIAAFVNPDYWVLTEIGKVF